jgi:WD40 repeat protein
MRSLLVLTGLAVAAAPLRAAEPAGPPAGQPLPQGAVRRFGSDGLVQQWDVKTGKRSADGGANRLRFALTPDGSRLVVGNLAGRLEVWDVATGRVVRKLAKEQDWSRALVCLAVSPDGRRVAAGEGHCEIRVFRIDGGECARRLLCPLRLDGGWIKHLAWAADGKSLFADGSGMIVCRVNLADGKTVWDVNDENMPWFAPTPDGRYLVKALWDGIQFLEALTGEESSTVRLAMTEEQGPVGPLAWAPDGKRLALAIGGGTLVICDRTGREVRRFAAADRGRWAASAALAFSPDGKWIVSGSGDPSVRVWETATGKLAARFDGHDGAVEQVAVAPDGRSAFSAGGDGLVYQWDLTPRPCSRARQRPDELWAAVAAPGPAFAVPAAWALVTGSEESRAFVAERLPPFAAATREEIAKWLEDLDAPAFADREAATQALRDQGPLVERQLRETLKTTASPEVRRRAEDLLARLENTSTADELRALRLVQACELSGTAAARVLLTRWSGGAPGALLTEDAKAALARLDHRPP